MTRGFVVVFGATAMFSVMIAVAARHDVPKLAADTSEFADNWRDAAVAVALKSNSFIDTSPKSVTTEVILPEIIATKEELTPKLKRKLVMTEYKDVCQRHHMRKVYRGRGWRCK
jgi:hypothetical protein